MSGGVVAANLSAVSGADSLKLVYSVNECAELVGIGRSLAWQMVRQGQLGSFKVGHRRLVAREDLEAFIADRREIAQGDAA